MNCKVALTIAGSDSGGGAGIQADLASFSAMGVFGTSAVTALTAQNPKGVGKVAVTPLEVIEAQIRQVMDFFPVSAVKTGMLPTVGCVELVAGLLDYYRGLHKFELVVDPVLVSTSGQKLSGEGVLEVYRERLFPLADVVTPNLRETTAIMGWEPRNLTMLEQAGLELAQTYRMGSLLKGGHFSGHDATDVLVTRTGQARRFVSERVSGVDSHGSGCSLASAVAACLAQGYDLEQSVGYAKSFIDTGFSEPVKIGGTKYLRRIPGLYDGRGWT